MSRFAASEYMLHLSSDIPRDIVMDFDKVISNAPINSIDGLLVVNGQEHVLYLYRAKSNHMKIKEKMETKIRDVECM